MRLRYCLVTINILIVILLGSCINRLDTYEYNKEPIVAFNDRYQLVEGALQRGEKIKRIEKQYDCRILEIKEKHYMRDYYDAINEEKVIFDHMNGKELAGKIIFERNKNLLESLKEDWHQKILIFCIGVLLLMDLFCAYLYVRLIRPFHKLCHFASEVALGNLDEPLNMHKHNYFGAFTESFDVMREELKKAKEGEYQANLSKRELVVSLSHDIKTPVATIKALCEILEIKLKDNEQVKKIYTIADKANLVDHLISNMFHATLEELEVLKIEPTEEPSTIIKEMLDDMNHFELITYEGEIPSCLIYVDRLRLNQVLDNIISNSYKYANTAIKISSSETETHIILTIRDFGTSVSNLDLCLVCEKFYRGENAEHKSGSGLGLYLAKTFMEGMNGDLCCEVDGGFVVTIYIQKAGFKN